MAVTTEDLLCRSNHSNHLGARDPIEDLTPLGLAFDEPAVLEAGEVPGQVRLAHAHRLYEVGHALLASSELKHEREPGRITESSKN